MSSQSALAGLTLCCFALISGCSGSAGERSAPATRVPFSLAETKTPALATPTVSLTSAASSLSSGAATTLSWSSTGATGCSASGGWTGSRTTSGSLSTGPIRANTTFSLSCSGAGGTAVTMINVNVIGRLALNWQAPTENVDGTQLTDLAGYRIYYGQAPRSYTGDSEVSNPAASSTTLSLPSGTYYVAMTALDAEGNESAYSNEVMKRTL